MSPITSLFTLPCLPTKVWYFFWYVLFFLFTHQVLFVLPNQNRECVLPWCMGNIPCSPESWQILESTPLLCYHVSLPSCMLWFFSYWSLTGRVHAEPIVLSSCAQFLCCFWKMPFPWCFPIKNCVLPSSLILFMVLSCPVECVPWILTYCNKALYLGVYVGF